MVTLTDKAARKVESLLAKDGKAGGALRVRVIGGGCSGLQYQLGLEAAAGDADAVFESGGVKVVVDPDSALYLTDSQVDWIESFKFSGFKVKNPNAVAECSCGQSFAV